MDIHITYCWLTIESIRAGYIIQTSLDISTCSPLIHIQPTTRSIPFVANHIITDFAIRSSKFQHIKELDFLHELLFTRYPTSWKWRESTPTITFGKTWTTIVTYVSLEQVTIGIRINNTAKNRVWSILWTCTAIGLEIFRTDIEVRITGQFIFIARSTETFALHIVVFETGHYCEIMTAKGSHIVGNCLASDIIIIVTSFCERIGSPSAPGVEITAKGFGIIGQGVSTWIFKRFLLLIVDKRRYDTRDA